MMFPPSGVLIQKNVAMMASPLWGLVGLNPLRSTNAFPLTAPSPSVPFTWSSAMGSAAAVANRGAPTARRPGSRDSLQPTASSAAPIRAGRTGNLTSRDITPHQTGKLRARLDDGMRAGCSVPATTSLLGLQPAGQIGVLCLEDQHLALLVVRGAVAARRIQPQVHVLARVGERREQLHGVLRVDV